MLKCVLEIYRFQTRIFDLCESKVKSFLAILAKNSCNHTDIGQSAGIDKRHFYLKPATVFFFILMQIG